MRKVLVVEQIDSNAQSMADYYGIGEIAMHVPRYAGIVTFYPAIVVESSTNPGLILGVFNPTGFSSDDLNALQDLPAPAPAPSTDEIIASLQSQVADLTTQLTALSAAQQISAAPLEG